MAQDEILDILESFGEMTIKDIAEILDIGIPAIKKNLRGLLKALEVERRIMTKEEVEVNGKTFTGRNMIWFLPGELHNEKKVITSMAK